MPRRPTDSTRPTVKLLAEHGTAALVAIEANGTRGTFALTRTAAYSLRAVAASAAEMLSCESGTVLDVLTEAVA